MDERLALSKLALNTYGMPSLSVTRTYSAAAVKAKSLDSSTLMPPKSTKGLRLSTAMDWMWMVDMVRSE